MIVDTVVIHKILVQYYTHCFCAQPTVLSIGIGSYFTEVSISDS